MALEEYDYELPAELLAHTPAEPRDSARLFVYDTKTGEVTFDTFRILAKYIPAHALLVLNNTKVVPARIAFERADGRMTEGLLLMNEASEAGTVRALIRRGAREGEHLWIGGRTAECPARVIAKDEKVFVLALEKPEKLEETLFAFGKTPLPRYIHTPLTEEEEARARYQSVFAEDPASVAAPTASLHLTDRVFADLDAKGVERAFVTLHVGMGTFAPVTDEQMKEGRLHKERFVVPRETVEKIRKAQSEGRPIIAVGTTAARALEASASEIVSGVPRDISGVTDIFIQPGYSFKVVIGLVTNFHLPKTSLMCLVDAFLQHKKSPSSIQELYARAIAERMRFYSFGDGMVIL